MNRPGHARARARHLATAVTLALLATAACGDTDRPEERRDELRRLLATDVDPNAAVATVDGTEISAETFARYVEDADGARTKRDLLDDLILAELLYEDALKAGYGDSDTIQLLHKRLMVQKLLERQVEDAHRPEDIDEDRVRAYYEERRYAYNTPALRAADHLLVMPDPERYDIRKNADAIPPELFDQAHQLAQQILDDIRRRGLTDLDAKKLEPIAEDWRSKTPEGLHVKVEANIITPRRDHGAPGKQGFRPSVVEPFAEAAFAASPHQLVGPVKTMFGSHLLVVTDTLPATENPYEDVEAAIRQHLATEDRKLAARALVDRVMATTTAKVDPEAPARLTPPARADEAPAP